MAAGCDCVAPSERLRCPRRAVPTMEATTTAIQASLSVARHGQPDELLGRGGAPQGARVWPERGARGAGGVRGGRGRGASDTEWGTWRGKRAAVWQSGRVASDGQMPTLSRNRPNYKNKSTKTIAEAIKFPYLSSYNSGSLIKSRGISNQPIYKPRS
jgi:hypothetical protein